MVFLHQRNHLSLGHHRPVFGQIQWMGKRRQFSPKLLRHAHVLDIKLLISCRYSINIWYIYIMYMYTYIYIHICIYICLYVKKKHELRAPCVGSRLRSSSPQFSSLKELEEVTPSSSDGTLIASFSGPEVVNKMPVLQSSRCQDADVAMETMAQKKAHHLFLWFIYIIRKLPRGYNQPLVYSY